MQVKLFLSRLIWTADCTQFQSENRLHECQFLDSSDSLFPISTHPCCDNIKPDNSPKTYVHVGERVADAVVDGERCSTHAWLTSHRTTLGPVTCLWWYTTTTAVTAVSNVMGSNYPLFTLVPTHRIQLVILWWAYFLSVAGQHLYFSVKKHLMSILFRNSEQGWKHTAVVKVEN